LNWGPKPFKFLNCWLHHPEFIPFVKDTWESTILRGSSAFILKEKLKRLKEALRRWNREVFGIVELNIEKTVQELNDMEDQMANDVLDSDHLNTTGLVKQFWDQIHTKESLLRQKSRTKWVQEGDSNTRFFHASIKARRRRNQIVAIMKGDTMIQGVREIKQEAKLHFSCHLAEAWNNRPFIEGINFNTLTAEDNAVLLEPFSEEEIRDTVWSCDGNKSPGPDGFNINFWKACWHIVKQDVIAFFTGIHSVVSDSYSEERSSARFF
jgi:hypothetical protein